jgi:YYY domain-containing protein
VVCLGIVPAVAYNLILPTLFSMMALGAFSLAWNLSQKAVARRSNPGDEKRANRVSTYISALAASIGMAVLGNLGTVKMIFQGFQKLVAPGGAIENGSLPTRLVWAFQGLIQTLGGAKLPYGIGDWYWNPSRIIPAPGDVEPITEFPYFSLLYADLHAHLIALSLTLLALALIIGIILGKARWKKDAGGVFWFLIAGLAIGALRPTNTWDFPTYLAFGIIGVFYAIWRAYPIPTAVSAIGRNNDVSRERFDWWYAIPARLRRLLTASGGAGMLALLAFVLFQPYAHWYALGYTRIDLWDGTHTPLSAYLNHWGVFLWVIVAWLAWETRDWLAKTPVSALQKLKKKRFLIEFLLVLLLIGVVLLTLWREVAIAWLVLPLAAWTGVLILRPDQPDAKRIVLFILGTGLVLTLVVEVIVLHGDIGRMNTVFKFYLQVWTIFAISAAVCLSWLLPALRDWLPGWRGFWQVGLIILVASASLYPIMATTAKIKDRMASNAPHTLDGMAYMYYATYSDEWGAMDLSQDYKAIRWMQENVKGSPVIVEANLRDLYRWGSRYTIYTGLPGVVGWEWHQQQQRVTVPGTWITDRILEIQAFYLTTDLDEALAFLKKYNVEYIIVGQQERGKYPGPGLEKFDQENGILWNAVYRQGETVIYKAMEAGK